MTPADDALFIVPATLLFLVFCGLLVWALVLLNRAAYRVERRQVRNRRKSDPPVPSSIAAQMEGPVGVCGLCAGRRILTSRVIRSFVKGSRFVAASRVYDICICDECVCTIANSTSERREAA